MDLLPLILQFCLSLPIAEKIFSPLNDNVLLAVDGNGIGIIGLLLFLLLVSFLLYAAVGPTNAAVVPSVPPTLQGLRIPTRGRKSHLRRALPIEPAWRDCVRDGRLFSCPAFFGVDLRRATPTPVVGPLWCGGLLWCRVVPIHRRDRDRGKPPRKTGSSGQAAKQWFSNV